MTKGKIKRTKGLRSAILPTETRLPRRPISGSAGSSKRTRVGILWAAQRVLATEGYAAFTTRAVASMADITPGNLAYHYKTKRALLREVITEMVEQYSRQIEEFFRSKEDSPRERFEKLCVFLIQDSATPHTSRLFREIWAMSLHDEFIAEAIDNLYARLIEQVAGSMRVAFPRLTPARAKEIVYVMVMMSEGTNAVYGTAPPQIGPPIGRVTSLAIKALMFLAEGESTSNQG